jgi:hypothetical protein
MVFVRPIATLLCLAFLIAGCQRSVEPPASNAELQVVVAHQAAGVPLQMGAAYANPLGETFTVNTFKYYLSNLALLHSNGATPIADTYFLVDQEIDSTKTIRIKVPVGTYTGLRMLLGVDSTRNVSGAQTGALDPTLDMFWTWNTGYIMAKLEGTSPLSSAPNNRIQYHIGGFSGANSSLRTVQINFPAPVRVERTLQVHLVAELMRWFDGVHPLPIAQTAVSMTPGPLASQYADNYSKMFRLNSVLIP